MPVSGCVEYRDVRSVHFIAFRDHVEETVVSDSHASLIVKGERVRLGRDLFKLRKIRGFQGSEDTGIVHYAQYLSILQTKDS